MIVCWNCKGKGSYRLFFKRTNTMSKERECEDCGGRGVAEKPECQDCNELFVPSEDCHYDEHCCEYIRCQECSDNYDGAPNEQWEVTEGTSWRETFERDTKGPR